MSEIEFKEIEGQTGSTPIKMVDGVLYSWFSICSEHGAGHNNKCPRCTHGSWHKNTLSRNAVIDECVEIIKNDKSPSNMPFIRDMSKSTGKRLINTLQLMKEKT